MVELSDRYQDYFAGIALSARRGSLDPSTKVGAVIHRKDRTTASTGFNGLPEGIPDSSINLLDKSRKYPRMVHAEANALDKCFEDVRGFGMTVTAHPCSACALKIISRGIKTVYYMPGTLEYSEKWQTDMQLAQELFEEAKVKLIALDEKKGRD